MDDDDWLPRPAAVPPAQALGDSPVVCLLGPRQSGKSSLAQRHDRNRPYLTFDDAALLGAATADPVGFLAGVPATVTLDEIQRVPALLGAIKMSVDRDRRAGRFLLTGSANLLLLPAVSESLAGRMEVVRLYPLTEAEKAREPGRFVERLLAGAFRPRIHAGQPDPGDLGRRCGKSTLQAQLMRRATHRATRPFYCSFEDTRLFGMGPQVCLELTPANRDRELRGAVEGTRLRGRRRAIVVTLDQSERIVEDGVQIDVVPAWRWLAQ